MKLVSASVLAVAISLLVGCDAGDPGLENRRQEILGGTLTSNSAVGILHWTDPLTMKTDDCTATLLNGGGIILTASHCVHFSAGNPERYRFITSGGLRNIYDNQPWVTILKIINYGPEAGRALAPSEWEYWGRMLTPTSDYKGNNDVAILFHNGYLLPPVMRVSGMTASGGETVTALGYGCTDSNGTGGGSLRYRSWNYVIAPLGVDPNSRYNPQNAGVLCPGDSGGPAIHGTVNGGGEIWGVNSFAVSDTFGNAAAFAAQIDAAYWAEFGQTRGGRGHF